MKITPAEKFLLALLLTGCLTVANVAHAADRITVESGDTYKDGSTGSETITDTFDGLSDSNGDGGGAIHNAGTITSITGTMSSDGTSTSSFTNNTTTGSGGAIYNTGTIGTAEEVDGVTTVTGGISNTVFEGNSSSANSVNGGAIYNSGTIGEISNTLFKDNKLTGSGTSGGAIYNSGTIGKISGSEFTGNTTGGSSNGGGAIYNASAGIINEISDSKFTSNSTVSSGYGGAIYNAGTITSIKDTTFDSNTVASSSQSGGAIYNASNGKITEISGSTFKNNSGLSGGAIYNTASIDSIKSSTFESNSAKSQYGGAINNSSSINEISDCTFTSNTSVNGGGAIYNTGTISTISSSTFTKNTNSSNGGGGAIYNYGGTISTISDSIFTENTSGTSSSRGGAIYNAGGNKSSASITSISGSQFTGNTSSGNGGAIYNDNYSASYTATIGEISGCSFSENSATNGGAIYNDGTITTIKNTSFYNNIASSNGGAIYSTKDLSIAADEGDVVFSGNTTGGSGDAIYMNNANTTITFSLSNGGTIRMEDSIDGNSSGYSVVITGDGFDTTFYLLSDISNASISVGNTTLSFVNDEIGERSLDGFTLSSDIGMAVDVDLENEKMDTISVEDSESFVTNGHTITITGMNILNNANDERSAIYFADSDMMSYVKLGVTTVTYYTPIYEYDYGAYYVYKNGEYVYYGDEPYAVAEGTQITSDSEDGGYVVFEKGEVREVQQEEEDDDSGSGDSSSGGGTSGTPSRYNPAVLASEVAQAGVYRAMNMMFEGSFEHSEYFMKLPQEVRLAQSEIAKAKKQPKENDPTKVAYYNHNELTNRGVWAKTFASNENVSYSGGYDSRDKYYGAMLGFDSSLRDHGDGWAHLFTGYVGTVGIRQEYSGGHIKQHGGFVGVTESFYKKNFYTAWTVAAGTTKANEHTMYGHDKERLDSYGIAARFGYNFDFGKFSILPTFTASYSTVNPEDFTSAADVHFSGSGLRAVQLNPNVKFIMNLKNGFQPYLTVGEVWTVGESSHTKATWNGTRYSIDTLDLKPYTEYGIGIQKRWTDEKDAYVQFLGHSDGRDGILVNAGIRWNF